MTRGLSLAELAARTKTSPQWLADVLADEQHRGNVEVDSDLWRLTDHASARYGQALRGVCRTTERDA